jgi:hypothetical protein
MKKRKDGWRHVIYKDKVPRVYFGRIGLGMDFCEEMTGVGSGSEAAGFQTSCFQQKTPCSIPICSRGLVRITGALRSLRHETYNPGPNGNRPEHRGPACPLDYRD